MSEANIDILVLTALTEEQQVVHSVLRQCSKTRENFGEIPNRVTLYEHAIESGTAFLIATACMHDMGAVAMGSFATALFASGIRPACAVLVGIAATIKRDDVDVGDVPVASEVFSADDIKVEHGRFTFRTHGYGVDHVMRMAAGAVREKGETHARWREQCVNIISGVVRDLNSHGLRRPQIAVPVHVEPPRLLLKVGAGGPFLIGDEAFGDALRAGSEQVSSLHPKLAWAEMEAHGFMKAALTANVPAIVVKGISDAGDAEKARLEIETGGFYRAFSCSNSVVALLHLLDQRPRQAIPRSRWICGSPQISKRGVAIATAERPRNRANDRVERTGADNFDRAALSHERIEPWAILKEDRYLIELEHFGDAEAKRVRRNLTSIGFALIRFGRSSADSRRVEAVARSLGPFMDNPRREPLDRARENTRAIGGALRSLGAHVDGAALDRAPAILVFEYLRGAQPLCQFWDAAHFFISLSDEERHRFLVDLAAPDAGTFRTRGEVHTGPLVRKLTPTSVALRFRVDGVLEAKAELAHHVSLLQTFFQTRALEFTPRNGDIVVLDNGRVFHGRDDVDADAGREHRRAWVDSVHDELLSEIRLGIRPVSPATMVEIDLMAGRPSASASSSMSDGARTPQQSSRARLMSDAINQRLLAAMIDAIVLERRLPRPVELWGERNEHAARVAELCTSGLVAEWHGAEFLQPQPEALAYAAIDAVDAIAAWTGAVLDGIVAADIEKPDQTWTTAELASRCRLTESQVGIGILYTRFLVGGCNPIDVSDDGRPSAVLLSRAVRTPPKLSLLERITQERPR